jgi:hypothetical protein
MPEEAAVRKKKIKIELHDVADFVDRLVGNADDADARMGQDDRKVKKKILVIETGELPKVAETLRDIIASSNRFFDRGVPVRITKKATNKLPIASPLTTHGVVRAAHQLCRPVKDGENATLPDRVAALYLDMIGEWKLPAVVVISTAPILSGDGSIRSIERYDKDTGIYSFNVPDLDVPEKPTREQAAAALLKLRQAFQTFPFSDAELKNSGNLRVIDHSLPIGHDESAFLNGLLTAICRPSLWLAPGLLLNAPSISGAGTGKGLLVRAISVIAYGERPRPFTAGNDRHEMDKRLVSEVIEGNPVVFLDNVNGTLLRSDTLASFLTERPSGVRVLGRSQMIRIELATFFALTGNGLSISEDLARRFIYVALDAQCEDPEQRPFGPGFLEGIEARRAELLGAALTIWRWGRHSALKAGITLGSFEEWGAWVRDPLLALGCKDPVARLSEIKARDPERQRVIELFNAWWENHGSDPVKVSELAPEVQEIADPSKHGRQYLARAIGNLAGTRQGGFVLERFGDLPNARKVGARYRLRQILQTVDPHKSSASSASSATPEKSAGNSEGYSGEKGADDLRMPADDPAEGAQITADDYAGDRGIRASSAGHPHNADPSKINALDAAGADNADDADDFGKSRTGGKPRTVITAGFHNRDDEEPSELGTIVVNGFAISATPEDRHEPEPGQIFARIRIRTVKPPATTEPDDDLFVV